MRVADYASLSLESKKDWGEGGGDDGSIELWHLSESEGDVVLRVKVTF